MGNENPQLAIEERQKISVATSELDATFVTFIRFQAGTTGDLHGERENSTIGITVTGTVCKPS